MLELRILNGYHRGAAMPFNDPDTILTIGAGDDADVVLADPGVQKEHAEVSLAGAGWRLHTLDGVLRNATSNQAVTQLDLALGEFARVDHIWLTLVDEHSPWQDPPMAPSDAVDAPAETDPIMATADLYDDPPEPAMPSAPVAAAALAPAPALPGFLARKRAWILVPLALTTVLSAAAAYAMTRTYMPLDINGAMPDAAAEIDRANGDDNTTATAPLDAAAHQEMERMARDHNMDKPGQRLNLPRTGMTRMSLDKLEKLSTATPAVKAIPALSQDELRTAFRKRLVEVDLLRRFNLQLEDRSWTMQAALDEDDADRFQRMLGAFIKKYAIDFPVNAKIGSAEAMLPFKIEQVISGSNASIVTDDGRRLYVGDEYRGMKLAGIEGNQLSFTGKRAINVTW